MAQSEILQADKAFSVKPLLWPWLTAAAVLGAYAPTFIQLAQGPWQTEQEGHGPLIIAASLWLVWSSRGQWRNAELRPAPIAGWTLLVLGLAMLFAFQAAINMGVIVAMMPLVGSRDALIKS